MARWAQNMNRQHKKLGSLIRQTFKTSMGSAAERHFSLPPVCHFFGRPDIREVFVEKLHFRFLPWFSDRFALNSGGNALKSILNQYNIDLSVRISIKNVLFWIFHIIFTGFFLSGTRRVLHQARIRDVKCYTNSELSPALKGAFPRPLGACLNLNLHNLLTEKHNGSKMRLPFGNWFVDLIWFGFELRNMPRLSLPLLCFGPILV